MVQFGMSPKRTRRIDGGQKYPCTSHNKTPISVPERGRSLPSSLAPGEGTRTLPLLFAFFLQLSLVLFPHHCALLRTSLLLVIHQSTGLAFPGCCLASRFRLITARSATRSRVLAYQRAACCFAWIGKAPKKGPRPKKKPPAPSPFSPGAKEKFKFDCRSPPNSQGLVLIHYSDWKAADFQTRRVTNPFPDDSLSTQSTHHHWDPLPSENNREPTYIDRKKGSR
ncbi:hypothetical protein QBC43DRAFT_122456 [Cladorrhinum sp. PSN259]|nr:hypothetical protein QBC43DRAFT_122456 [Cladorrhinum sp. PSN259]